MCTQPSRGGRRSPAELSAWELGSREPRRTRSSAGQNPPRRPEARAGHAGSQPRGRPVQLCLVSVPALGQRGTRRCSPLRADRAPTWSVNGLCAPELNKLSVTLGSRASPSSSAFTPACSAVQGSGLASALPVPVGTGSLNGNIMEVSGPQGIPILSLSLHPFWLLL